MKEDYLMLGPPSFVNACSAPNCVYTRLRQTLTLPSIRPMRAEDEITVKHSIDYFGDGNKDCLCPNKETEF